MESQKDVSGMVAEPAGNSSAPERKQELQAKRPVNISIEEYKRELQAERKQELLRTCAGLDETGKVLTCRMVDEMVFLEGRLDDLRTLPQIDVNPKNPARQRQTAAFKQYKELLQQYTNCVKVMIKVTGSADVEEESPLRAFINKLNRQADL